MVPVILPRHESGRSSRSAASTEPRSLGQRDPLGFGSIFRVHEAPPPSREMPSPVPLPGLVAGDERDTVHGRPGDGRTAGLGRIGRTDLPGTVVIESRSGP